MLHEGATAPAWNGTDQNGQALSSVDLLGSPLLLYFYPKDDTPGCTLEACGFRDSYEKLSTRIRIVGVSADSVDSHRKFVEKYKLPFTLIADPDKTIIRAFGTDGVILPKRVTFLIDATGVIRKIYHGFDCTTHAK